MVEEKTDILIKKLKSGDLDLAFLALPINETDLESCHLFDDQFYIAVSQEHELYKQEEMEQKDLHNHTLMLLDEGHCLRDQALDICGAYKNVDETDFRATSLETLRQMVRAGTGITFMPATAIRNDDGIKYIPIKGGGLHRKIGMVWRKTSARKEAIEKIYDAIKVHY